MIFAFCYTEHMPVKPICVRAIGVASALRKVAGLDSAHFERQYDDRLIQRRIRLLLDDSKKTRDEISTFAGNLSITPYGCRPQANIHEKIYFLNGSRFVATSSARAEAPIRKLSATSSDRAINTS